jgi:hypothetical protein
MIDFLVKEADTFCADASVRTTEVQLPSPMSLYGGGAQTRGSATPDSLGNDPDFKARCMHGLQVASNDMGGRITTLPRGLEVQ